jgi:hypothetical protein
VASGVPRENKQFVFQLPHAAIPAGSQLRFFAISDSRYRELGCNPEHCAVKAPVGTVQPVDTHAGSFGEVQMRDGDLTIDGRLAAQDADIKGWVESATDDGQYYRIVGWAYDPKATSSPLSIVAFNDDALIGQASGSMDRDDIAVASGVPRENKQFVFQLPHATIPPGSHVRFFAVSHSRYRELVCNPDHCAVTTPGRRAHASEACGGIRCVRHATRR